MPTRLQYRQASARELGADTFFTGTATSGSTTTLLECDAWPFKTTILSDERFEDYHVYRPDAASASDRVRTVVTYDSAAGQLTADKAWSVAPYAGGTGESFELMGVLDPDEIHRLVGETLKLCEVMVEVTLQAADADDTRHSLAVAASWLDDPTRVLQVGYLTSTEDRDEVDPYDGRTIRGEAVLQNGVVYLTGFRHNTSDTLYVMIARPAYTYCRVSAGSYGGLTAGLTAETDEAVPDTAWVAAGVKMLAYDGLREKFWPGNAALAEREAARAASRFWALARKLGKRPPRTFVVQPSWGPRQSRWLV